MSAKQNQKDLKHTVPDGGWGWMIVLGSTVIMSLVNNLHVSYGVMFSAWYSELDVSSTMVGIILNTNCVLWTLMYLFVGPLSDKFGLRRLGLVSNFMTALSLILSAFATSTSQLLFSYSILGGIFGGLSIGQIYIILPKFFDKHLGVANAFPMAGFSVCQFAFPILIPMLQAHYGFKGSMLVLGGIVLNGVAAAALFQPPEWHKIIAYGDNYKSDKTVYQQSNNVGLEEKSKQERIFYDKNANTGRDIDQPPNNRGTEEKSMYDVIIYDEKSNTKKKMYHPQIYIISEEKSMHKIRYYDVNGHSDNGEYQPPNIVGTEEKCLLAKISEDILCVFKSTTNNLQILKKPSAFIISLGLSLFIGSSINYYGIIPFVIVNAGYSLEDAGWVMSYGAVANFLARILSSTLSDFNWFKAPIGYVSGTFSSLIAMIGFALTDNFLCLKIFSVMQGFGHGAHMGLFSIVTKEIVGPELHSASMGASGVMLSMGFLTVGPFLGFIRDLSGSYTATLLFMAVLNALSVLLWILMPLAKSYEKNNCNAINKEISTHNKI